MRKSPVRILCTAVTLLSLMFVSAGCAQRKMSLKEDGLSAGNELTTLQAIKVSEDASSVVITANRPLTYTFYKLATPPKGVIDLSQTEPGDVVSPMEVNSGNIKRIDVGRHGSGESMLSRIEISLVKDGEISVAPDPENKGKLVVTVANPPAVVKEAQGGSTNDAKQLEAKELSASPAGGSSAKLDAKQDVAAPAPDASLTQTTADKNAATPPAANQAKVLTAVNVVPDGLEVKISGGVDKYNAFKLAKPSRLVLDVFGVKNGVGAKVLKIGSFGIGTARLGVSPDKVRIVFDSTRESLPPYQIVSQDSGVKILFKGAGQAKPEKATVAATQEQAVPKEAASAANSGAEASKGMAKAKAGAARSDKPKSSSVEAIDFKAVGDYSQIAIKVTGDCKAERPVKAAGGWVMTIKNCQLPRRLQRMLDTSSFPSSVREITPYQVRVRAGYDAKVLVKIRNEAPFNFRQEGGIISWDIRNPLPAEVPAPETVKVPLPTVPAAAQRAKEPEKESVAEKQSQSFDKKKIYTGRRVTLEFSDADVRKIFQLIAEVSNLNFLIADDVTGTISLKLVNVPWDQALDVILETKNLEKRQEGNILYIKQKGKFKTAEQEEAEAKKEREKRMELKTKVFESNFADIADVAGQFDKLKSERGSISQDKRTNRVIVTDNEDRLEKMAALLKKLDIPEKQVMIEARIVEASSTFSRDLGVNWGISYKDGSASFLGINQLDAGLGGVVTLPATSSATGTTSAGGTTSISFGKLTSNIQVDLRLSAAATAGLVKIISTPKVVTLNNKAAKISQGQNIPYQTTSAEGTQTQFVQAALSLEVTPHITADGSIGLKIKASNNSLGDVPQGATAPSINTKEATTEVQVANGETTVIGGIYVDSDTETNTGVPFLMDIPLLGWLFKSNSKLKTKSELLIFITPRIVS